MWNAHLHTTLPFEVDIDFKADYSRDAPLNIETLALKPQSHRRSHRSHAVSTTSPLKSKHFYHSIPSKPRLVTCSSPDIGLQSTGPKAYLLTRSHPIGLHPLQEIWEAAVGPNLVGYLDSKGVKWTSLDPICNGYASKSSPSSLSLPRRASRLQFTVGVSFPLTILTSTL